MCAASARAHNRGDSERSQSEQENLLRREIAARDDDAAGADICTCMCVYIGERLAAQPDFQN